MATAHADSVDTAHSCEREDHNLKGRYSKASLVDSERVGPRLDPLRAAPRFIRLTERVGLIS